MVNKKAKGKSVAKKTKPKKAAKKSTGASKRSGERQVDMVAVRKSLSNIVGAQAKTITKIVVQQAKDGQLATMKYLFEMAGVYPASTEELGERPEEDSLARTLMERLQIPFIPLPVREDDDEPEFAAPVKVAEEEKELSSEEDSGKVEGTA